MKPLADPVPAISGLLTRYRAFSGQWASVRLAGFSAAFDNLRAGLAPMQAGRLDEDRAQSPRFNVFRDLHLEEDEDRVHTPFLANLLNPNGSHGQRHLFLRECLDQLRGQPGFLYPSKPIDQGEWFVETEKVIGSGMLDLVLSNPALRYILVIENKVRHHERPDQISDYYRWMSKQSRFYDQRVLIYLTPQGIEAKTARGCPYYRLSYRRDIAAALSRAVAKIESAAVRAVVEQYLAIILRL